jgi:hypothetical protein
MTTRELIAVLQSFIDYYGPDRKVGVADVNCKHFDEVVALVKVNNTNENELVALLMTPLSMATRHGQAAGLHADDALHSQK